MVLGQSLTKCSTTAKHTVGTRYIDPNTGAEYVYCVDSGSGSAQYKAVTIAPTTFSTQLITTANAAKGFMVGVPQLTVTASTYYWCMIRSGRVTAYLHTASACATEALLWTTATAGRLDDEVANTCIAGIILTTASAATAAASANAVCSIDYPSALQDNTNAAVSADASAATTSVAAVSTVAANAATSVATASSAASVPTKLYAALSTYNSVVVAGSVSESGTSVATASYAVEGAWLSRLVSCAKSTG